MYAVAITQLKLANPRDRNSLSQDGPEDFECSNCNIFQVSCIYATEIGSEDPCTPNPSVPLALRRGHLVRQIVAAKCRRNERKRRDGIPDRLHFQVTYARSYQDSDFTSARSRHRVCYIQRRVARYISGICSSTSGYRLAFPVKRDRRFLRHPKLHSLDQTYSRIRADTYSREERVYFSSRTCPRRGVAPRDCAQGTA